MIVAMKNEKSVCAKCGKPVARTKLIEVNFVPRKYKLSVNKIGVCQDCKSICMKSGLVKPDYYKYLNKEQKENLKRQLKSIRSNIIADITDENYIKYLERL